MKQVWEGKRHDSLESLEKTGRVGDWCVRSQAIWLLVPGPGGLGTMTRWQFDGVGPCWTYNGDPDAPTLVPSLVAGDFFHGWLKDGKLQEA